MKKLLYESNDGIVGVSTTGKWRVYKTTTGICVTTIRAVGDNTREYYKDGNYPTLPNDWVEDWNDYVSTASAWIHQLVGYTPYRTINF